MPKRDPECNRPDDKSIEDRLHLLSLAVEQTSEGIGVVDLDGILLYLNPAFAEMHGYSPDDLVGKHLSVFHSPEQMEAVEKAVQEIKSSGRFEGELWHSRRDGSVFLTFMRNAVIRDSGGEPIGMLGTVQDITEQKRTEDRLQLLSQITEQVTDSVIAAGLDFTITYANRAFTKLYGYSASEVMGKSPDILNAEPMATEIQAGIYAAMGAKQVWKGEHLNRRKDGSTFPCEMTVFPLLDEHGEILAFASTQRDVTECNQAEDELRSTTTELQSKQKELLDKNTALTEILDHIEEQRQDYRHRICREIEQTLLPVIQRARLGSRPLSGKSLDALEDSVKELLNRDIDVFKDYLSKLTPRELEICNLLKQGMSSKEIASSLNTALVTVNTHRQRIRKKLGIDNKSINLSTWLRMY